ncbi:MAG: hypothetical protein FJ123_00170 [Deltaproteobacteria bacterium]|nr:hypothetical protein [Deltaproteobacteria bacterium]
MEIRLTIDTDDRRLAFDLMGNPNQIGSGTTVSIPGICDIKLESLFVRKAAGAPETLELILNFALGVAGGVLANWIYSKLKGRRVTLRIEEQEVEINEDKIKKVISRIIEYKK